MHETQRNKQRYAIIKECEQSIAYAPEKEENKQDYRDTR
jgi:hypothetical protein